MRSKDVDRRSLNQAVFEAIYVEDDEIVGSDMTPAFQRLVTDSLPEDLRRERKQAQSGQIPTTVLKEGDEIAPGGGRTEHTHRARRAKWARSGVYLGAERPWGRLAWEETNNGPRKAHGWDLTYLVGVKGLEPSTSRSQTARASQLRHTPMDT